MVQAVQRLTELAEQNVHFQRNRDVIQQEQRFTIKRRIMKITAASATSLMDEVQNFEEEFRRTRLAKARDWVMALEEALEGKAREWRDYVILTNPGLALWRSVQAERPTDQDYMVYYRSSRGELFARCGLQYENPGEHTKKQWAEYSIPERLSSQEDMDEVIREVTQF